MMEFILVEQSEGKYLFQVIAEGALHYFYLNNEEVIKLQQIAVIQS